jgi:hypothetical protein
MGRFSYLMWWILKKKNKPEQGYWQIECKSGLICDDGSLICNKIREEGWKEKGRRRRRRNWGGGVRGRL